MTTNDFKDWLFDVMNEADNDLLADIETMEAEDAFLLKMADGSCFEVKCRSL